MGISAVKIGSGGVTSFGDGTAASPTIYFSLETSTGFYRPASGTVGVSGSGIQVGAFSALGAQFDAFSPLTANTSIILNGSVTDGATAIGAKIGNSNALTNASAKILAIYNDAEATEKTYFDSAGLPYFGKNSASAAIMNLSTSGNSVIMTMRSTNGSAGFTFSTTKTVNGVLSEEILGTSTTAPLLLNSSVSDGASAISIKSNAPSYETVGAKIHAFYNGIYEMAYIAKRGMISIGQGEFLQLHPQEYPPNKLTVGTATSGGSVDQGTHTYKVTFITANGETDGGTVSNNATTSSVNKTVPLSAIPIGGSKVTGRNIYRNKIADQTHWFLLTAIANNTATTYTDTTADASLTTAIPTVNTTANQIRIGSADATGAVGLIQDTTTAWTLGKLHEWKNNAVIKAYLDASGILYVDTNKRVACGGGSTGAGTTPNGTVTLEINGTSYYLLTSSSA